MGNVIPDRFFWALPPGEEGEEGRRRPTTKLPKIPDMSIESKAASTNAQLFARAQRVIPGGVNSPVRAFKAVGGTPRFIARGEGAYIFDAEGKRYIDYIGSWGPMILGHGHPAVLEAVQKAAVDGFSFGAPTEREVELAEEILKLVPSMEQVRLVSSGTEAAMSAIRLARGATGRDKIVKFEGCYHGHADALLVKAGSGLATFGNPTSAGVPPETVQHTLVLEYNNLAQLDEVFALHGNSLACVVIEPIAGNMNFVRASVPFMKRLRELCSAQGTLLVFDEVITVFRVALVSLKFLPLIYRGFAPTSACSAMSSAAFRSRPSAECGEEKLAPLAPVYRLHLSCTPGRRPSAGTLRKSPRGFCDARNQHAQPRTGFVSARQAAAAGGRQRRRHVRFFSPIIAQTTACDGHRPQRFHRFFTACWQRGVPRPALYEAGFVSAAHT